MKSIICALKLASAVAVVTWAAPASLGASPIAVPLTGTVSYDDQDTVRGSVNAKTDTSLTVDGTLVTTTLATMFTKDGKGITMKDITVGDKVRVRTMKGPADRLQALEVEVVTKDDKRDK
jgi:hypothetical protein